MRVIAVAICELSNRKSNILLLSLLLFPTRKKLSCCVVIASLSVWSLRFPLKFLYASFIDIYLKPSFSAFSFIFSNASDLPLYVLSSNV